MMPICFASSPRAATRKPSLCWSAAMGRWFWQFVVDTSLIYLMQKTPFRPPSWCWRKAGSIKHHQSLPGWLYRVAWRLAVQARTDAARRPRPERLVDDMRSAELADEVVRQELRDILDQELQALPEKFQLPVVLCHLQGKTLVEAAQELGWAHGTVASRLSRARDLLRQRLTRRGVTLTATALGMALAEAAAPAAVPAILAASTVKAAVLFAAGTPFVSAAAILAEGVLRTLFMSKFKVGVCLVLALSLLTAHGGALAYRLATTSPESGPSTTPAAASAKPSPEKAADLRPILTDSQGDPLPEGAIARLGTERLRHGNSIRGVGFLPGGQALMSADWHGVLIWDITTGRCLRRFGKPHEPQFWQYQDIAFSGDGRHVVLTVETGAVQLWDAVSGKMCWEKGADLFPLVVLSPNGKRLALTQNEDNSFFLRLWDAQTGKELHKLLTLPTLFYPRVFSPDSKTLLAVDPNNGRIRFWDVETGKQVRTIDGAIDEASEQVERLVLSPDGTTLAFGTGSKTDGKNPKSGTVFVYNLPTGKLIHRLGGLTQQVCSLAFTPDGKTLLVADWLRIRFCDLASGKEMPARAIPVRGILHLAISPDGQSLLSGGVDGTVQLWDLATGRQKLLPDAPVGSARCVAIAPDGRTLATGHADTVIRLWDTSTGREKRSLRGHTQEVCSLSFSADGQRLISAASNDAPRVWDPVSGKELFRLPEKDIAFAIAGDPLLSLTNRGALHLWNVRTGQSYRPWQEWNGKMFPIDFTRDRRTLVMWGGKIVSLWDVATGKERCRFPLNSFAKEDYITSLAVSPNGRFIAVGSKEPHLVLYDLATGEEVRHFPNPPLATGMSALAFSPDSRTLASADERLGTVRLWEIATGRPFREFPGHRGRVYQLAFSADGRTLVSASEDTTTLVWDVTGRHTPGLRRHRSCDRWKLYGPTWPTRTPSGASRRSRFSWRPLNRLCRCCDSMYNRWVRSGPNGCPVFSPTWTMTISPSASRPRVPWAR